MTLHARRFSKIGSTPPSFGPEPYGFYVTDCEISAYPGGRWRIVFRSDDGSEFLELGEFREVAAPERLVFTLRHVEDIVTLETVVTVTFAVEGSGTRMTFKQTGFDTKARRDDHREGWGERFQQLKAEPRADLIVSNSTTATAKG